MTIKKTASFVVAEGEQERALEVIRDFVAHAQTEPGTLLYESWQGVHRPQEFLHFMEFADEAAEKVHRSSDEATAFTSVLYPLCTTSPSFVAWHGVTQTRERSSAMGTDVVTDIEINRPRPEVADYVSDPDNATEWYENVTKVEWKSPRSLDVGSQVAFEARFMGQTFQYTYEIAEYVPGESLIMRSTEGPFDMRTTYKFSDTPGGGTRMQLGNLAHDPDMATAIEEANRKDLARLKSILEAG